MHTACAGNARRPTASGRLGDGVRKSTAVWRVTLEEGPGASSVHESLSTALGRARGKASKDVIGIAVGKGPKLFGSHMADALRIPEWYRGTLVNEPQATAARLLQNA